MTASWSSYAAKLSAAPLIAFQRSSAVYDCGVRDRAQPRTSLAAGNRACGRLEAGGRACGVAVGGGLAAALLPGP